MITIDFSRLTIRRGDCILDVGCGSGRHSSAAARQGRVTVISCDLKLEELMETRARLDYERALGVQGDGVWAGVVGDIRSLPFKSDAFDIIICSEVLEHVLEHEKAAAELIRVLKGNGILAVSVPRYWPERVCWALSRQYYEVNGGHVRIYRKGDLISLFESRGLRPFAHYFAHSLHTPYWWLKCLMGPTRDGLGLVRLYHDFLVWDMMRRPRLTGLLDSLLNKVLGKSLVVYFKKEKHVHRN
ncbi:MAG: class I SAM-dependent methyltransferase [Deltaproteobacteria bacterium]|nr:class I SAM-dependent methyltransferase [Deltaproteobacteria bacterium]MBW1928023.1 class I SAM-dependent methyltransferase [Deltaproteobacteria bacterium]MBW2024986.1 class I SAM-dependent methyltransferase [Deltaproteobacteria bacterium]MBW2126223.1 class I SAM-dependent methyltransferase [Deltaproteobacteria bacterium]